MLFAIILILIFIFLFINLLFYVSIRQTFSKKIKQGSEIKISVVVAAKNEEENITGLISALSNQNYDKNLFEVIIVDDDSSDKTYGTASEQIVDKPNFKIIKPEKNTFPGKKGAFTICIDTR